AQGHPLPPVRIAIGFPSTGRKGRVIGECWDSSASADRHHEILIRPDQADCIEVAAILAHELIHAAVGIPARHGPRFRRVALAIGLTGKMTATRPGPDFLARAAPLLEQIGPLPHAALGFGRSTGPRKQGTRLIKCECQECGYIARVARKWLEDAGAPHCPDHGPMRHDDAEAEEVESV
nr:SprT-like domain-containing protein [Pseudomonadota bacterium]